MYALFGIMKNNFSINSIGKSSHILQNTSLKQSFNFLVLANKYIKAGFTVLALFFPNLK